MWPMIDGLRMLRGDEASLVRGAVGMMIDHLVDEYRKGVEPWRYGIDAFDMWEADQRIWLVDQVVGCLLTRRRALPPAAIWEATIDAIFCEVVDLIEIEITDPILAQQSRSWRQTVFDAYHCQHGRPPVIDVDEDVLSSWRSVVASIADVVSSTVSYQKAEAFRDGSIDHLQRFLIQRGLPEDFLERIPPLRSVRQTQASINRIQKMVRA